MKEYQQHFSVFSQNIDYAARILHYHLHLGAVAPYGTQEYDALNQNARFWRDFRAMSIQTVVLVLGKIFDKDHRAYSVDNHLLPAKPGG